MRKVLHSAEGPEGEDKGSGPEYMAEVVVLLQDMQPAEIAGVREDTGSPDHVLLGERIVVAAGEELAAYIVPDDAASASPQPVAEVEVEQTSYTAGGDELPT